MSSAATMIRRARRRRGITQAELARRSGVAVSTLSLYENGRREPSVVILGRLLRALGLDLTIDDAVPRAADKAKILERVTALGMALPRRERGELDFPPFHTLGPS